MYPYDLFVHTTEGGSRDENGNFIPGTDNWINISKCRDQKGSGKEVKLNDGTVHVITAIIFCPVDCSELNKGDSIEVRQGESIRIKETVKMFSRDMLHCRIWV